MCALPQTGSGDEVFGGLLEIHDTWAVVFDLAYRQRYLFMLFAPRRPALSRRSTGLSEGS